MADNDHPLEVYAGGELTVIGFRGRKLLEGVSALNCRDQLARILSEHKPKSVAFDLTGLKLVPSGMLGLFAAIKKTGVDVLLFNPTDDIREVLEITKLDTIVQIHRVDVA